MSEKEPHNRYSLSAEAYRRALKFLAGGVNSPVRAFAGLDTPPVFMTGAKGSRIYDVDGNEYIDYVCSWGAQILGHSHPKVLKAVESSARKGTTFGAPVPAETSLAEKIVDAFSSVDNVRLVSSGTEAVMSAVRLARAYTGRDLLIKMAGCYHGHSDSLLVSAGSGLAEASRPSSAGVPKLLAQLTTVVPYNDIDSVESVFKINKGRAAAVIVEPVAANMGVVPPAEGYLQGLRDLCDDNGAVLIFDEVITGFRVAYGGAQQLYGVNADITCLGKIVGGGLPAAAFGGGREIMNLLAPSGPVYQAGTLSGNPVAVAAANATIDLLKRPDTYEKLNSQAERLERGLKRAAANAGIELTVNRVGSLMSCFFASGPVRDFEDVRSSNIKRFKRFFTEMLKRGIYLAPSAYEAMFISLAHSQQDIERTIEAGENSFRLIIDI